MAPHEIPEDDGPSPLDVEGLNPFGGGPFGEGPFGPHEEQADDTDPHVGVETILQRHKVDRLVGLSRKRYAEYQAEWRKEREEEAERVRRRRKQERELKAKRTREAIAYAGEKAFALEAIAAQQQLDALWRDQLRRIEQAAQLEAELTRAAQIAQQAQAMNQLRDEMGMRYRQAMMEEQAEEEEVLELLMAA